MEGIIVRRREAWSWLFSVGAILLLLSGLALLVMRLPAPAPINDRMQVLIGGIPRPFTSGGELPVVADMMAIVRVHTPNEPHMVRDVELFLYRQGTDEPIDNARILGTAHMVLMDHGVIYPEVQSKGNGRYIVPIEFPMTGEWQLDLQIGVGGTTGLVQLTLEIQ